MIAKIKTFDFKINTIISGKYRILKKIGKGHEGEVFLV